DRAQHLGRRGARVRGVRSWAARGGPGARHDCRTLPRLRRALDTLTRPRRRDLEYAAAPGRGWVQPGVRIESAWTRSASLASTLGSVSGSTPWPRLNTCPSAVRPRVSTSLARS